MAEHNGVRITIEEWASDNNISLTDEQIDDLQDAVQIAYEVESYQFTPSKKNEENKENTILKNRIDMLERYLLSKGYNITVYDDHIERFVMRDCVDFSASDREYFS